MESETVESQGWGAFMRVSFSGDLEKMTWKDRRWRSGKAILVMDFWRRCKH